MRRLCVYFIEYSLYRPGYLAVCVHVQCDICAIHIVAVHSICSICVWLVARIIRCLSFIHKQLTRCGHGALNRAESLCTTHALTLLAQWPQPDRSTLMHAAHFLFYFFLLQRETCKYFVYSIHTHTQRGIASQMYGFFNCSLRSCNQQASGLTEGIKLKHVNSFN